MKKIILGVIALVIVIIGGFYVLNSYIYNEKQGEFESITSEGTIVTVSLEQVAVDGPAVVVIETPEGQIENIVVPSMGLPLCTAFENIEDVFAMKEGQYVEVRGYEASQGGIIPCDAPDHYLRVRN